MSDFEVHVVLITAWTKVTNSVSFPQFVFFICISYPSDGKAFPINTTIQAVPNLK